MPDGLPSDLLHRRPNIAQAGFSLAAPMLHWKGYARSPKFGLTGSTVLTLSHALANPITIWSLGTSARHPFSVNNL